MATSTTCEKATSSLSLRRCCGTAVLIECLGACVSMGAASFFSCYQLVLVPDSLCDCSCPICVHVCVCALCVPVSSPPLLWRKWVYRLSLKYPVAFKLLQVQLAGHLYHWRIARGAGPVEHARVSVPAYPSLSCPPTHRLLPLSPGDRVGHCSFGLQAFFFSHVLFLTGSRAWGDTRKFI